MKHEERNWDDATSRKPDQLNYQQSNTKTYAQGDQTGRLPQNINSGNTNLNQIRMPICFQFFKFIETFNFNCICFNNTPNWVELKQMVEKEFMQQN